jgi:hypothetical protein
VDVGSSAFNEPCTCNETNAQVCFAAHDIVVTTVFALQHASRLLDTNSDLEQNTVHVVGARSYCAVFPA